MKKDERAIVIVLIVGFLSLFSGIGLWFVLLAKQSKGLSESFLSVGDAKQIASSGIDYARIRLMEDATKNFSTFLYGPYIDGTVEKADWAYPKEEFIDRNLNGRYDRGEKLCSADYDFNGVYTPSVPLENSFKVSYHKTTLPLRVGNVLKQVGVSYFLETPEKYKEENMEKSGFYKYYALKLLDSHSQIWINGPVELDDNGKPVVTAYGGHILSRNAVNMLNTLGDVVTLSNGLSINENFPYYKLGERIAKMMSMTKGGEFFAEVQLTSSTYREFRLTWEEYEVLKDFITVEGKKFKLLDPRYLSDVECEPDRSIPDVLQNIRLVYKKCEYTDTKGRNLVLRDPHWQFGDLPITIIPTTNEYPPPVDPPPVEPPPVEPPPVEPPPVEPPPEQPPPEQPPPEQPPPEQPPSEQPPSEQPPSEQPPPEQPPSEQPPPEQPPSDGGGGGPGLPDVLPFQTLGGDDKTSAISDSVVSLYRACPSLTQQGQQQLRRVADHLNTSYGQSPSTEPDTKRQSPAGKIGVTYQERVPINLNTAPREVLIALFTGIRGTYIDYQKSSTLAGVQQLSNPVTLQQAAKIADYIIAYRKKQPFRSYRDIEAFFSGDSSKILSACGKSIISECYDLKCNGDYTTGNFDWRLSFLDDKQKEAILANILPQSRISKFNPDITLGRTIHSIDKSDLVDWTTEATFTSYGYFEVEGLGTIVKRKPVLKSADKTKYENVLVAQSKVVVIYRLWDTLHLQSQKDFEESSEQVIQDKKIVVSTSPKKVNTVSYPENVENSKIYADWDGYLSVKPEQLPVRNQNVLTFQSDLYTGFNPQRTKGPFGGTVYDGRSIIASGADGTGVCPDGKYECTKEWTNLVQSSLFPDGVWLNEFKRYPYNYNPDVRNEYGTKSPNFPNISKPVSLDTYLRYPSENNFSPDDRAEEGFMEMWVKPSWDAEEQEVIGSDYVEEDTRTFFSMGGGVERGIIQIDEPSCNSNDANSNDECNIFMKNECPGAKLECRNNRCECPEQRCKKDDCGLNCPPDSIEVECNGVCKCIKDPSIIVDCYKDKDCNNVNCEWNKECIYVEGQGQAQRCKCVFDCNKCSCTDQTCKDICKDKCSGGGSCPTDANELVKLFNDWSQVMEATCTNCMSTNSCTTPNPYIAQFDCQCLCKGFDKKVESTRCKDATGGCFGGDGPTGRWCKICGKCTADTCQVPQDCKICKTFRRVGGGGGGGGCQGYKGGPGLPEVLLELLKMSSTYSGGYDNNGDGICDGPPGDPNINIGVVLDGMEWTETDTSCTSCNFDCVNGKCECTAMNVPENYLTCSADSSCPPCIVVGYSRVKCNDGKCYCVKVQ